MTTECSVCGGPDSFSHLRGMWLCPCCAQVVAEHDPDVLDARAAATYLQIGDTISDAAVIAAGDADMLVQIAGWLRCYRGDPVPMEPGA